MKAIDSYKYPDYNSGKVLLSLTCIVQTIIISASEIFYEFIVFIVVQIEVQYLHKHASFTTAPDLKKSPAVDFSATIGTPTIAFGTEAQYIVDTGNFAKYNAGVCLTKPKWFSDFVSSLLQ